MSNRKKYNLSKKIKAGVIMTGVASPILASQATNTASASNFFTNWFSRGSEVKNEIQPVEKSSGIMSKLLGPAFFAHDAYNFVKAKAKEKKIGVTTTLVQLAILAEPLYNLCYGENSQSSFCAAIGYSFVKSVFLNNIVYPLTNKVDNSFGLSIDMNKNDT